jgi:hypothetical protein
MSTFMNNIKSFKEGTRDQFDQFIFDNSKKSVLKELKDNGIAVDEITEEELSEMIAEEAKNQREFTKGLAVGSTGFALILGLLG